MLHRRARYSSKTRERRNLADPQRKNSNRSNVGSFFPNLAGGQLPS